VACLCTGTAIDAYGPWKTHKVGGGGRGIANLAQRQSEDDGDEVIGDAVVQKTAQNPPQNLLG
jgi:hypothetical protein